MGSVWGQGWGNCALDRRDSGSCGTCWGTQRILVLPFPQWPGGSWKRSTPQIHKMLISSRMKWSPTQGGWMHSLPSPTSHGWTHTQTHIHNSHPRARSPHPPLRKQEVGGREGSLKPTTDTNWSLTLAQAATTMFTVKVILKLSLQCLQVSPACQSVRFAPSFLQGPPLLNLYHWQGVPCRCLL